MIKALLVENFEVFLLLFISRSYKFSIFCGCIWPGCEILITFETSACIAPIFYPFDKNTLFFPGVIVAKYFCFAPLDYITKIPEFLSMTSRLVYSEIGKNIVRYCFYMKRFSVKPLNIRSYL